MINDERGWLMIINKKIKYEKLKYHIGREAVKISALSSGQVRKYDYFTGKEINRHQVK